MNGIVKKSARYSTSDSTHAKGLFFQPSPIVRLAHILPGLCAITHIAENKTQNY